MKIGLISDTHIPRRAKEIPKDFLDFFKEKDIDLIIHCGDLEDENILKILNEIAEVKAVKGNTDYLNLPEELIFNIGNFRILVFHSDIVYPRGNIEQIYEYAKSKNANIVVFGHTHLPFFNYRNGIYFINPGTATGVRSGEISDVKKSVAILDINENKINVVFKLLV